MMMIMMMSEDSMAFRELGILVVYMFYMVYIDKSQ